MKTGYKIPPRYKGAVTRKTKELSKRTKAELARELAETLTIIKLLNKFNSTVKQLSIWD